MADDLPSEYDAIILGTGLPESVVAAALSRIGFKILHLDRNDYYSGYWASFSFDNLLEWIKENNERGAEHSRNPESVVNGEVCFPSCGNKITNIEVQSYLRKVEPESKEYGKNNSTIVSDSSKGNLENVASVCENLMPCEPTNAAKLGSDPAELTNTSVFPEHSDTSNVTGPDIHQESGDGQGNDFIKCVEGSNDGEVITSNTSPEYGKGERKDITERVEESNQSQVTGSNISPESGDRQRNDITNGVNESGNSGISNVSEVAGSNINPESENKKNKEDKRPPEESSPVDTVISWAKTRKVKNTKKLDKNSTHDDFSKQSRKFNIDLSPKVLFSRGLMVESLINANISHYAEFKIISRILTKMNGKIEDVPCSRSDVFSSELINVLEKRALMRFITFCSTFEDSPSEYESFQDKPFMEFLKSRKLTSNLQYIILNAIAGVPASTSTLSGLKATQKFLRSLGRYGNTPFLWSLYGTGELPQAFCRMSAVFGGIYCLRKNVKSLVLDEDNKNCLAVISEDGQRLKTKWLIMETSYAPDMFDVVTESMTSRAIVITDKSLSPAEREHISMLTLQSRSNGSPVRVIELTPSSMACPESLCIVHFTTETVVNALEDLNFYVQDLFTTPDAADNDSGKPVMLWSVYFNVKNGVPTNSNKLPLNVRVTSLPSAHLDFEDAMFEAKEIFTSICPNEDFLPAVPNPEDIIWDDIGSCTKEEKANDEETPTIGEPCSAEDSAELPDSNPGDLPSTESTDPEK
ncbi:rab proteins geranylgeranyltransferase component A 1-like [Dendronephthya gigantea]|uniref:rab proteins geranylgeranyltransferase component A 1-like n=1 Tax=Dendronephthya gigantea TaxID=151771 RepID=UPI00106CC39A|nr:rab proteins geranylgeranyltransferase component A 1-like [Dendronephthya gigantea]